MSIKPYEFPTSVPIIIMSDFEDQDLKLFDHEPKHNKSIDDLASSPPKPSPDKKSRTPIKFTKTGESIYNRGKEFLNSVEQKRQDFASTQHSFRPKINEKSAKMIQNALKEGRDPREKKTKEELKKEEPEEKKKRGSFKEFIERNYKGTAQTKKNSEKDEEIDSECTFKPRIDDKSKEMVSSLHSDLFRQAEDLKKKKADKIEQAKKQKAEKELDGCTFHPQISKSAVNISPQGKTKKNMEIPTGYAKNKNKYYIST
jgi:hypothetical protein